MSNYKRPGVSADGKIIYESGVYDANEIKELLQKYNASINREIRKIITSYDPSQLDKLKKELEDYLKSVNYIHVTETLKATTPGQRIFALNHIPATNKKMELVINGMTQKPNDYMVTDNILRWVSNDFVLDQNDMIIFDYEYEKII